ncbi:carboxypeptidase regulatory-like domain-containing protein [Halopiger goleimassiliensis]|uniref:carboxypeptidase regulatory-like domain-containing protein n=1 Tax=Halopiger goleimassiliensis TaxID=1293048 RepID=UPI00067831B7|nr:carboxypeptidase regulatory-like domain-containing protein [Halopiger goleimassiliensis]
MTRASLTGAFFGWGSGTGLARPGTVDGDDEGDGSDDGTGAGEIRGTVTHFGEPVPNATVSLSPGSETTTDDDGTFELESTASVADLAVSADGYVDLRRRIPLDEAATADLALHLEREWGPGTGDLEVFATPVGGGSTIPCRVTVYGDETYAADAPNGSIPDGDTWDRGFEVADGWWEVRVSEADGYSDGYAEVYVGGDETENAWVQLAEGDAEIPSTGRVRGTVVDADGNRIDDATVLVDGDPVAVENGTVEVDLEHGRHPIVATADGYERSRGSATVRFGRTTDITVSLEPVQ